MPHITPVQRVFDAIKVQGGHVKQSGGQWMCTCPAHDDRNPSLSIKQGNDESVLLNCFAGCTPEAVVQAIGLEMRDLFASDTTITADSRTHGPKNPRTDSGSGGSVCKEDGFERLDDAIGAYANSLGIPDHRWEYHNAQGELVGVILRWDTQVEGKPGKEIRPISFIEGRWVLKGMPGPRPLYRLPSIMKSDELVIVCEGEKAADAALACGYTATTSPHGSKNAQNADWSSLKGRDVVIVPDIDEPGEDYARVVFRMCRNTGAQRVRIVDLHGHWEALSKGDDLVDVLSIESGDTESVRTKLDALIEQTQPESSVHNSEVSASVYRPFPVNLLPEPVRSYVSQGASALCCDVSYVALPMLVMLAGTVGNSHRIRLKTTWVEPCIMWGCVVGRSGTNKSGAINIAMQPLHEIQNRSLREYQSQMQDWDPDSGVPRPVMNRSIIDEATIESVLQLLEPNPKGLLLRRDELNGWFNFDKYANAKGSTNSARWIELFHGRDISVDRATKDPIFVPYASLSIIGGIQPGILRSVLDSNNMESGLAARFLFVMPPHIPKRWSKVQLDHSVVSSVVGVVEALYELRLNTAGPQASEDNPQPHIIDLSPEALALFEQFYNEHNLAMESEEERVAAAWSKLECYVPRLALLFHLIREAANDRTLEDHERVDAYSMQAAIDLVEWFKHETRRVYAMLAMDETQQEDQRVIDWINKRGGEVSAREFSRGLARYNDSTRAQQKLDELEKAGYGRFQGRPPHGKTRDFILCDEYRAGPASTDTATCHPQTPKTPRNDSVASGRYPVPSNRKEQ